MQNNTNNLSDFFRFSNLMPHRNFTRESPRSVLKGCFRRPTKLPAVRGKVAVDDSFPLIQKQSGVINEKSTTQRPGRACDKS